MIGVEEKKEEEEEERAEKQKVSPECVSNKAQ